MEEKQKEKARLRKQRQRDRIKKEGVTLESVTAPSVTLLERPNGAPYNRDEMWQGLPRYIGPYTDGQVLDRKTVPLPNRTLPRPRFTPNNVIYGVSDVRVKGELLEATA